VEARRILFGNTLPKKEYLERGALADLFLDTPLVNAHTSVLRVAACLSGFHLASGVLDAQ